MPLKTCTCVNIDHRDAVWLHIFGNRTGTIHSCVSLKAIVLRGICSEVNLLSQFLISVSFFGHQATSLNYLPLAAHYLQLNSVGGDF